jgi:hypothetical protein
MEIKNRRVDKPNLSEQKWKRWVRLLWKENDGEVQFSDYFFRSADEHNDWVRQNFLIKIDETELLVLEDSHEPDYQSENLILSRMIWCYDGVSENEAYENSWNNKAYYID